MDKLKKVFSGQDGHDDDINILQAANEASKLGWGKRVKRFIACFVLGALCSVLGVCLLWLPRIGPVLFAVLYTVGNLASLISLHLLWPLRRVQTVGQLGNADVGFVPFSIVKKRNTLFLMGPLKQLKMMCDKSRALASAIMLTSLVLTLCAAIWWKKNWLALLFCILQFLASAWYGLSYIPFARDAVMKMFSMCLK
ncbi:hypothetical protein AAFF_G00278260 [Aldrovandia affinis]|uniref:Vesicle transport protein n=1 Tax=Aldrovandia affinis TaxID=143900 RepID=A0AAD7SR01_9TELE|nr:hypothetical protein AAFF_G00278260 [Aldrovandia affinis]